jgi:hypothetical protein
MGRIRYSNANAHLEATRRAAAFIADRADRDNWRYVSTSADRVGPSRRSSKHPVVWVTTYAPVPSNGEVIDGGELVVIVDLELDTVGLRQT